MDRPVPVLIDGSAGSCANRSSGLEKRRAVPTGGREGRHVLKRFHARLSGRNGAGRPCWKGTRNGGPRASICARLRRTGFPCPAVDIDGGTGETARDYTQAAANLFRSARRLDGAAAVCAVPSSHCRDSRGCWAAAGARRAIKRGLRAWKAKRAVPAGCLRARKNAGGRGLLRVPRRINLERGRFCAGYCLTLSSSARVTVTSLYSPSLMSSRLLASVMPSAR